MMRAALTALGLGQLVNWGVLYYAFAILLEPVRRDLAVPSWVVTGAFSLALLVSALLAPLVGRWNDRGHARRAIALGGVAGAALLVAWALVPGVLALYAAWLGLGVCMAAALYEPAFALVTRSHASAEQRLRALAVVTVFGGLASTVFLPATGALVATAGWRRAVLVLAGLLVVSTVLLLLGVRTTPPAVTPGPARLASGDAPAWSSLRFLVLVFGTSSLASAAFIANLVPALGERGLSPATAAMLGGLFGVMQLPGRALLVHRGLHVSGEMALTASLGLQALGLLLVAGLPTRGAVVTGVAVFAAGSGLTTLARPFLVQGRFALDVAGLVNGRLARAQQLTRAAGPALVSLAAAVTSHTAVLALTGAVLGVLAWRTATSAHGGPRRRPTRPADASRSAGPTPAA
jgi:MFS family permease